MSPLTWRSLGRRAVSAVVPGKQQACNWGQIIWTLPGKAAALQEFRKKYPGIPGKSQTPQGFKLETNEKIFPFSAYNCSKLLLIKRVGWTTSLTAGLTLKPHTKCAAFRPIHLDSVQSLMCWTQRSIISELGGINF